jgi:4-hydroxythreonine-4-phosphate dehydrogenase
MIQSFVAVTTGDQDGIGPEITQKALRKIKIPKDTSLLIFSRKKLGGKIPVTKTVEAAKGLSLPKVNILSSQQPPIWVEECARLLKEKRIQSLVTGPLSKELIKSAGLKDVGHTDILKRVSHSNKAYMGFVGKYFNVVLATGHLPLQDIHRHLTRDRVKETIEVALQSRSLLDKKWAHKPLGVLGLNPHAGDGGIIGDFEVRELNSIVASFSRKDVVGPLPPDSAFQKDHWKKFSFFVALYHDQGLIPFKMIHGFSGVHVTLGLDIKRCSVDHGTAKDIAGKGVANPGSMIDAIRFGIKMARLTEN